MRSHIACNLSGRNGVCKSDNARKEDKKNLLPYFTQSGSDREGNGDQHIANMRDGAWAGFKYFAFDDIEKIAVTLRGTAQGCIEVSVTQDFKALAASIAVSLKGDTKRLEAAASIGNGTKPLYFRYIGDGAVDFLSFELI